MALSAIAVLSCDGKKDDPTPSKTEVTITVSPTTMDLKVGENGKSITATVKGTTATPTWTSSDKSVAVVSKGFVTPKGAGTATITASVAVDGTTYKADCRVTVTAPAVQEIKTTGITLNPTSKNLKIGESFTISYTLTPANHTDNPSVTWLSSYANFASMDNAGKVTALAEGQTTITATVNGVDATCAVTVTADSGSGGENPGTGTSGNRVKFDAQGQYIPVTWKDADASQDNITLEGWFNPSSLGGSGDEALHCLMGVEGYLLLRFDGSKLQLNYASGESYKNDKNEYEATNLDATTSFQTGTWYHIAATYSKGGKVKLYVNGEEAGSADAPKNHGLSLNGSTAQYELPFKFYIGAAAQPKRYFAGSMYELRVWSVARTADEIKNNKDKHVTSGTGLLASWAFSDGSGNTVADKSGNGYNITSNGTLKWENGSLPF